MDLAANRQHVGYLYLDDCLGYTRSHLTGLRSFSDASSDDNLLTPKRRISEINPNDYSFKISVNLMTTFRGRLLLVQFLDLADKLRDATWQKS